MHHTCVSSELICKLITCYLFNAFMIDNYISNTIIILQKKDNLISYYNVANVKTKHNSNKILINQIQDFKIIRCQRLTYSILTFNSFHL